MELGVDHKCYEELVDERKKMEELFEERISQLEEQHAEVRLHAHVQCTVPSASCSGAEARVTVNCVLPVIFFSYCTSIFSMISSNGAGVSSKLKAMNACKGSTHNR